ncbi:glucosidase [uncultured Nostoc sp.]|uniref:MGH1-like glycoside hydrolase domain-containing protein n=1 Tax=uncultured Nostoc sp. TaxID=340711 RepID=UPI0035CA270B
MTAEEERLQQDRERIAYWRRWGSYLSNRQWGTVREDYSHDGSAWDYFPHDHARSRAYRWGEDGIAGISDNHQRLCFAIALWNEQDPILKERMFGLTGSEGNHGEDVKEYYFFLDNTPSHAYMKCLYKYPQQVFPYTQLVEENRRRSKQEAEFELIDTGVFDEDHYFDVFVEYAKASAEDILIQITIANRSSQAKPLHLLPSLWFRNTWSWNGNSEKPVLKVLKSETDLSIIEASHPGMSNYWLYCQGAAELLFTENETNFERLYGVENASPYVKDGFHEYVVHERQDAVNPNQIGTKFAADYKLIIPPGGEQTVRLRLADSSSIADPFGGEFEQILGDRIKEADEFYQRITPFPLPDDKRTIQRQAFAGMLWSKQFYLYVIEDWLKGDQTTLTPPDSRWSVRNADWVHLHIDDVLSMPDTWEYPWFAAWDLAFHMIPLAMIDPDFAKQQLQRLTREWYMHPNGQLPAYEWKLSDVNPPVHAWAVWQVYQIEQKFYGHADKQFLERVFQKLLLNFTWWVNRKDADGKNIFQGGFLGMDNIGVFDRSATLPTGGDLEQADGTSWMAMFCMNMLTIALELAVDEPIYEDIASKFFEHFLRIAAAMDGIGNDELVLWDEEDGFFYDALLFPNGHHCPMKVRSMVGLVPLFAVGTLELETLEKLSGFRERTEWFIKHRPDLTTGIACMHTEGEHQRHLLAILDNNKLKRILRRMLDEREFLSPYGIRSVSKFHAEHPFILHVNDEEYRVDYEPAESTNNLFGGNSNWRGPIWFPMNYLIIEALYQFDQYLGNDYKVECPTGSGEWMTLKEVAINLSKRLERIFQQNADGDRPVYGAIKIFQNNPHWRNLLTFNEYFHGDNGTGLGASHQTGWTGVIAQLIYRCGESLS